MNISAITSLTESTDVAIRILEQKLHDDIAGLENKVSLALIEIEKTVGNEKDDMKSKVAVVNLLSNRIYQLESYAQTNRSHIYPAQDKMEGLGGQVQAMIYRKAENFTTVVVYDNKPITNLPQTIRDLDGLDDRQIRIGD